MDDVELLNEVKIRLSLTGEYHDPLIKGFIEDVIAYMSDAGVPDEVFTDSASIGCIARGVADLWNYGSGDGEFSKVFKERTIQLCFKE